MGRQNYAWLLGAIGLLSGNLHAAIDIKGELVGNSFRWDNVSPSGSELVSNWQTPPSLRPTQRWVPATFNGAQPKEFTLRSTNGTSGNIPISISGIEYNTTGIPFTVSQSSIGTGCSSDKVNLPIIFVQGQSCVSGQQLESSVPTSPFVFFRPVFNIQPNDIIDALKGEQAGYYTGTIPLNFVYKFYERGVLTQRLVNDVIIVGIDYNPAMIENVIVRGDGNMEPKYDKKAYRISGEAKFEIDVSGSFVNGIRLTMPSDKYELVNSNDSSMTIPYQIICPSCNEIELVDDQGNLIIENPIIGEDLGPTNVVNFELDFKYDVDGTKLSSGTYNDAVTILIEPGI
ncbi:hypothetical protein NB524_17840 [Vibrio alginolyticus]|uniref:hypothetical protein n=1 Tax=Vibrio alginolyticus TaxID=663 RepID=UPI00215D2143|nr:hypothetical protein [Vibrio alginolyticus]MCR9572195.1 hypothetical protein [Vibrio alginolyticus]